MSSSFALSCCSVLLVFIAAAAERGAGIPSTLDGPFTPRTVGFDPSTRRGSDDLTGDDPRVARTQPSPYPEQISIALSTPDAMWVSWVTGEHQMGSQVFPLDTRNVTSIVQYGTQPGVYESVERWSNASVVYSQLYPYERLMNYTSGLIHHVRVEGLKPSTTYYYRCGSSLDFLSEEHSFTTLPPVEPASYPGKIAIVGDFGLTDNSSTTLDHIVLNEPDLFLLVGDMVYADNYLTNGTGASCYSCSFPDAPTKETYQPRWDLWGRFMQKLTSTVPTMVVEGNHEVEPQIEGKTFESYKARVAVPSEESGSGSKMYYSFDAGGIHFIMLGSYVDFSKTSAQYAWLLKDLQSVDRRVTPWLVATWHLPWYSSYRAHYREGECMRQSMEDLLYEYKVDIVFVGHVHAYERMNRVYNYTLKNCAPVHILVGDGGNIEKVQIDHADDPGTCPSPSSVKYSESCLFNFTSGPAQGNFCWNSQPDWSAMRDGSFGHGILEVKNATHALWTWHRNQDIYEGDHVGDQIYIVRQPHLCNVNGFPTSPSPASPPSPVSPPAPAGSRDSTSNGVLHGLAWSAIVSFILAVRFLVF